MTCLCKTRTFFVYRIGIITKKQDFLVASSELRELQTKSQPLRPHGLQKNYTYKPSTLADSTYEKRELFSFFISHQAIYIWGEDQALNFYCFCPEGSNCQRFFYLFPPFLPFCNFSFLKPIIKYFRVIFGTTQHSSQRSFCPKPSEKS